MGRSPRGGGRYAAATANSDWISAYTYTTSPLLHLTYCSFFSTHSSPPSPLSKALLLLLMVLREGRRTSAKNMCSTKDSKGGPPQGS